MQQSIHRPLLMSTSTVDATVDSKRRRVDLGMPRGILAGLSGKGDTNGMLNGTDDMMDSGAAGHAADLLRKMLHKHGHSGPLVVPDIKKNGLELRDEPITKKTFDDDKTITNGNAKEKMADDDDDDDKSSDSTEPMESGTDDGDMTRVKGYNTMTKENGNDSESQNSSTIIEDDLKAKRARVENIITSMRKSPTPHSHPDQMAADAPEAKRQKRKQNQPQPQRSSNVPAGKKNGRRNERRKLKELLGHLQQQLDVLQEKYIDLYEEDNSSLSDDGSDDLDDLREPIDTLSAIRKCEKQARAQAKKRAIAENAALLVGKGGSLRLRDTLKKELVRSVYSTVDNIVEEFASKHTATTAATTTTENQYSSTTTPEIADTVPVLQFPNNPQQSPSSNRSTRQTTPHRFEEEQTEAISLVVPSRSRIPKASPTLERSRTSSPATPTHSQVAAAEASDMLRHHFMPQYLPTSVAIPNPSLHPFTGMSMISSSASETNGLSKEQKDVHDELRYTSSPLLSYPHHHPAFMHGSPGTDPSGRSELTPMGHDSFSDSYSQIKMETESARGSPDLSSYSRANGSYSLISTLTPTHLRKAKLMFFFVRYPSSALLRQHFPDVQFNRHNTSQIIKWFSNFREFYYIQMEKFARQAVSDGLEDGESLVVTRDSELYRVLTLHYNKSNDFHVPDGFIKVSTSTLKEFFDAIKSGKDVEPSWKKTIYKVIGKLDEIMPDFFKSPSCLDDLE